MTFFSLVYGVQHYICNVLLNAISIGRHDIAELLPKLAFSINLNQSTISIGGGG